MPDTKTNKTLSLPAETKAMPDNIKGAFDGFMQAFESFKTANDRRLGEIERRQTGDVVTTEKVDRINRALDEHKAQLDEMMLKGRRPALGGPASGREARSGEPASEHARAFDAYMRRGEDFGLKAIEAKAFSVGVQSEGGYLVPAETDSEIGRRMTAISPMRGLATIAQVSGSVLKKPYALSGMAAGWVAEKAGRPETASPVLGELSFDTMELYAMPAATQTLLDDAAIDIEAWIAAEVDIAFAEQEAAAFISGDGINKPKGILSYPVIDEAAWIWGKVGYVPTGAAGSFAATGPMDRLIDAVYALKAGHRQNAQMMMNRATQASLRKFKDADGNYLWQPPASLGQPASLIGFPVTEAEDMPDIAAGSFSIAIGDFAAGYLVVDRTGIRVLRDPYSAKPYVLFYTTKRVGGGIKDFEAIKLIKFATT